MTYFISSAIIILACIIAAVIIIVAWAPTGDEDNGFAHLSVHDMHNEILYRTRLENALLHIATMDVYTRDGEQEPHELMRAIACDALETKCNAK